MTTRKHKKPKYNKSSNRFRRTRSKKHIGGGNNKPLRVAIDAGDIEKVRLLLDKGTDVNERDDYQYMPLHRALEKGRGDIAKMLLDKGADIEAKSESGGTALKNAIWYAGWNDYKDIVEMLLKKGADVNAETNNGRTALSEAQYWDYHEIVELLEKIIKYNKNNKTTRMVTDGKKQDGKYLLPVANEDIAGKILGYLGPTKDEILNGHLNRSNSKRQRINGGKTKKNKKTKTKKRKQS